MKIGVLFLFLFVSCFACNTDKDENTENEKMQATMEMVFDKVKWNTKEGKDYPYRDKMLKDVIYNDTIRTLIKEEIIDLLGKPDRINENFLYYRIAQKRLGFLPLHTKSMVIKLYEDNTIEWIKIHE
jgi:hypothetical protein